MAEADPARTTPSPFRTIDLLRQRSVEAVLSQAALNHPGLVAEIRRRFGSTDVACGALVRDPVIEGTAPFKTGRDSFADLAGTLLHPEVVRAISDGPEDRPYRFSPDAKPYLHQIEAWRHLTTPEPQSVLVSSGTGSGKTECFLMPVLHDLATEAESAGRLSGVRALALYPLNALIASQEERLRAWTGPFGGRIRFGLYNGLTPEPIGASQRSELARIQAKNPEQVYTREILRADPPPILVTNVTMLEYLTVRRIDRPLLDNSQGKLRWIILDEAHSYVGSAAAEIALLLRRVLLSFGVSANQVRFVATSATIGEGRDVTDDLRRFLRDISGADERRVHIVTGEREKIDLPPAAAAPTLDRAQLADREAIRRNPAVQALLRSAEARAVGWHDATAMLAPVGQPASAVIEAIAADHPDGPVLPLRVHAFLRAVPGLWSCLNPDCSETPAEWLFGAISVERVDHCPACRSPVFEIISCRECGEPYLDAIERSEQLVPRLTPADADEFTADGDPDDCQDDEDIDDQTELPAVADWPRAIATRLMQGGRTLSVDPSTGDVHDRAGESTRLFWAHDRHDGDCCGGCGARGDGKSELFRPFRFGAPFLIGNATPVLLEGVPRRPVDSDLSYRPPADGRQILSFTDSRQGTARFAANLQTSAERAFVRAFVYHSVQDTLHADPTSAARITELEREIAIFKTIGPSAEDLVRAKEQEVAELQTPSGKGIAWEELRGALARHTDVAHWMRQVWRLRDPRFETSETQFAEFLLLRELARRPRRANSLETMGLARLRFDAIDGLHEARLPASLAKRDHGIGAWRDFLYLLLDSSVRGYFAMRIDREDMHWLVRNGRPVSLIPPGEAPQGSSEHGWPAAAAKTGATSNAVLLLEKGLQLDRTEARDRAEINELLRAAWDALRPVFSKPGHGDYALDLSIARVAPVTQAWLCPVTRRILPVSAFGLSPYGHREGSRFADIRAEAVEMPRLPVCFPRGEQIEIIRVWLNEVPVDELRQRGLWGNLQDRSALFSPYLRAAEHSAQQPAGRLRRFETEFKAGSINVLNCSTTMEMGVDIGSVSSVMMTNVPPSIANYRQRVGRAGRRRQGFAASLTYTRDTPLDRETFRAPELYLKREVRAPSVKLDSRRIVQRHVNAMLLAKWFAEGGGEAMKTKAGDFFGCPNDIGRPRSEHAPVTACREWLIAPSTLAAMAPAVRSLTKGTILEGDRSLHAEAEAALAMAERAFGDEWTALQEQAVGLDQAARTSIGFQLKRLCGDNLLKELSIRAVLPGHGFPNSVVPFVNTEKPDRDEQEGDDGGRARRRSYPSRNLDVAIRDYAPGAQVVVDGLVYTSAGVTLNWLRPAGESNVPEIQSLKTFWTCSECGASDSTRRAPDHCPACHAAISPQHKRRFLEPAGFTVDMAIPPHADTDKVSYVEPEPERVVARGAVWQPFADPALGRMRRSADGLVFYSSAGVGRNGYALCLECGRAEAETKDGANPLADHRPLRFTRKAEDGLCPGNAKAFKVQRHLALGHEIVTDVAEIRPEGLTDASAAWALASALREALARELGIEAREMGIAVKPVRTALGAITHALFLYDRDAGGAGFAPQAVDLFESILLGARTILDCQIEGCETGCSACILTNDLYRQQEIVERRPALALVEHLLGTLDEPGQPDLASADARFSRDQVDEIAAAVDRGASTVTVWAGAGMEVAALTADPFLALSRRIADRGGTLNLVLSAEAMSGLDVAQKLAVRDAALKAGFALRSGSPFIYPNGAQAIAATTEGARSTVWASRDPNAACLGEHWGQGTSAPVVRVGQSALSLTPAIDLATLLPTAKTGFIEIGVELDGPLVGFGRAFVQRVRPELERLGCWKPGLLKQMGYTDRYLHSPLAARLLIEVLAAFRDALGDKAAPAPIEITTNRLRREDHRQPSRLSDDWQWAEDRANVFETLADARDLALSFSESGAAHSRILTLDFGDRSLRLVLDQGFGFWRTPPFARFDFGRSAADQAKALLAASVIVQGRGSTYVVVTR